jgi:4-amino-4-deoxy-L-arabinose transferase-like glycosyltransferase
MTLWTSVHYIAGPVLRSAPPNLMIPDKWKRLAVILAVCAWFGFRGIGSVSFIDPDEGMYGSIAREMAESGDWITARFDGVRYLNKPPLHFWLSALTFKVFGLSEWGVRLWSALPAFGTALLIWALGSSLHGAAGGFISALIFSSTVGISLYSHVTLTDLLLVFSMSLAIAAAARSACRAVFDPGSGKVRDSRAAAEPLLFYLGLVLGILSKGLAGLLLPVAIVGAFSMIKPNSGKAIYRRLIADRYALLGALLFFVLVTPWHVLAARNNPGFAQYYLLDNQFLRYLKGGTLIEDDVSITTPTFLALSMVWFLPWSALLPAVLKRALPKIKTSLSSDNDMTLLPLIWAAVILLFFSLSSSKLEHYSLPALPALSLMTGGWWAERLRSPRPPARRARYLAVGFLLIALVGMMLLYTGVSPNVLGLPHAISEVMGYYRAIEAQGLDFPITAQSMVQTIIAVGLALLAGISAAAWLLTFNRVWAGFFAFLLTSAGISLLLFRLVLLLEPYHSTKPIAAAILARSQPHDLIVHEDPLEYSGGLSFYTGRKIFIVNGKRGSLEFGSRYPEAREIFLDTQAAMNLWDAGERIFFVTRLPPERSIVRLLPERNVRLLGQFGARWLYTNRD